MLLHVGTAQVILYFANVSRVDVCLELQGALLLLYMLDGQNFLADCFSFMPAKLNWLIENHRQKQRNMFLCLY